MGFASKEAQKAYLKRYYEAHKEAIKAASAKRRQEKPEATSFHCRASESAACTFQPTCK